MLKQLFWDIYFKITGLPHRSQIRHLRETKFNTSKPSTIGHVMDLYADGFNINEIGFTLNIPRTRVRSFLYKAIRYDPRNQ